MAAKYIPPHLRRRLASAEASAAADTEPSDSIDPVNPAGSTVNESEPKIRDVKLVATYNWIDKSAPTILVRDYPRHGTLQNADRNPRSPIEPLIRAVLTVQPEFAFDGLDIVSDRRPLSHLLNFARNPKECSSFKFGVQLVGKTLILVRIEDKTRVYSTHLQYRNAFEQTYTAVEPVAKRTTSHHRILNYKFGSINLLVRAADLVKWTNATTLASPPPSLEDPNVARGVFVVDGGRVVPQAAVLELTTRSAFSKIPFKINTKIPDLWISQTPHFVGAYYKHEKPIWETPSPRAVFDTPKVTDVRGRVQDWEARESQNLQKFAELLNRIIGTVRTGSPESSRGTSHCLYILRCDGKGADIVVEQARPEHFAALPEEFEGLFGAGKLQSNDE